MNDRSTKIIFIISQTLPDLSYAEIITNFSSYLNRMRLIPDQEFDSLTPEKKIATIFELNEDQLAERDRDCFLQMQSLDFTKQDLSDAIHHFSTAAESEEELVLWAGRLLSKTFQYQVRTVLSEKIKSPVHIIIKTDPTLILGCKVKFRQKDHDLSFQGRALNIIRQSIKSVL